MISLRLAFIFLFSILYVSAQSGSSGLACLKLSNCTDCKASNGCGYCDVPGGAGICFPSVSQTLCTTVGGRWNPDTCAPPALSTCMLATDCNSCLNSTGCGWCDLGDYGVCHSSNLTCNAVRGSFFTSKCPTGTHCGNYSSCQDCVQDTNCTSCQITPTTFTCVSAAQKDLFCPSVFYKQGASCNVSQEALTCASRTTCGACSGNLTSNSTSSSQPTNSTQSTNSTNVSCGWCNFGTTQGGECFAMQDQGFCKNVGLWNEPCPQPGQPSTCTNVTDLKFCTGPLNPNNNTDMPWVLKLHDSYLNQRWNKIGDTVHNEVNNNGIGFCNDCWNAYKQFLCAAASPACGMASCYQNAITSATDCIAACPCDSEQFVVQPACFSCVMQCTTAAVAPRCGQFGLSKQTCVQLVNICGCNPSADDANTICSDFSEQGMNVDLGNGTCTDVPTWCGLSSGNQTSNFTDVTNFNASDVSPNGNNSAALPPLNNTGLMQPQAGRLCPNSHVCLSIYNAIGADVIAVPVTTLGGVDNNGNPGTNGTGGNNSAAVSACASPLLLLAALFLALFV